MEKLRTFLINYVEKMTAGGVVPKVCYTGDREIFDFLSNICEVSWHTESPDGGSDNPDMVLLVGKDANGECAWSHTPGVETVVTAASPSIAGTLQNHFDIVNNNGDVVVYTNSESVAGCLNLDVDTEIETIIELEEIEEELEEIEEIEEASTTLPPETEVLDWEPHQ